MIRQQYLDQRRFAISRFSYFTVKYLYRCLLICQALVRFNLFWFQDLPLGVVHKLESCSRNFYWGDSDLGSGIHWMKWQYFTKPRCEGGVGIKEVLSWNKAFLLKWLWKLVLRPPSLWLAWAEGYLLNGESIWNVQAKATSSWVWSDILQVRDDLLLLCGDSATAHGLIEGWTVPGINKFCLKAAYDFFRVGAPGAKKIMVLWEPFALPKYSIVGWQAYHAKLATIDNLQKRGFHFANRCYLCYQEEESHSHLFFLCPFMRLLWRNMMIWIGVTRRPRSLRHELEWIFTHCKGNSLLSRLERTVFIAIIYHGWIERNYRVFRSLERDVHTICNQIQFEIMCRYYGRVTIE
ncbi:hypothetical protein RND81_05G055400 [Saponaria officinalis]|uniref:Reverse transcriptase zinc-binding domain-containing protein n=1 Tax=Saponaria officinalis TaxID=3572 RepID=A0AAW1KTJ6_SAPOF